MDQKIATYSIDRVAGLLATCTLDNPVSPVCTGTLLLQQPKNRPCSFGRPWNGSSYLSRRTKACVTPVEGQGAYYPSTAFMRLPILRLQKSRLPRALDKDDRSIYHTL